MVGALELMLSGDPIPASEAWRIGLVNRVVAPGELAAAARALAERLASQAPVAVRAILDAVREGMQMSLAAGCEHEAALFGVTAGDRRLARGHPRVPGEAPSDVQGQMRDSPRIEDRDDATGLRLAIVMSAYHAPVTNGLRDGALAALARANAAPEPAVRVITVPGAFELPLAARQAAESGAFDALVCLGCIIRGETPHFDYIAIPRSRTASWSPHRRPGCRLPSGC